MRVHEQRGRRRRRRERRRVAFRSRRINGALRQLKKNGGSGGGGIGAGRCGARPFDRLFVFCIFFIFEKRLLVCKASFWRIGAAASSSPLLRGVDGASWRRPIDIAARR